MKTTSTPFLHHFFAPLPEAKKPEAPMTPLNLVANYVDTTEGAWDTFRVISQLAAGVKHFACGAVGYVADKVGQVFGAAGAALSFPRVISDVNNLSVSITNWSKAHQLSQNDLSKDQKIIQTGKKVFKDTLGVTGTISQMALFAEDAKLLPISATARSTFDVLGNTIGGVLDSIEFVDEAMKWRHYKSLQLNTTNSAEVKILENKKTLALMTIVKDVASITGAVFGVLALIFGGIPLASLVFLTTGTLWLTMKLTAHFYNKVVVETPTRLPLPILNPEV